MSFVSGQFLLFVAVVVVLFYVVPQKYKWVLLLVASYSFYLFGGIKPFIFIILSTFSTFGAGLMMGRYEKKQKKEKRRILIILLLLNFGILLLLKYYNFFAENIDPLFRTFEYDISMPLVNIMLPLGISFYTFQAMGYAIDIYRGKYEPETNLAHFALFVSFFPQIMQGPISRYNQLAPQFFAEHRFEYKKVKFGIQLMLWGFFKKMVIADRMAILVDTVFPYYYGYDGDQVFVAMFCYAIQIYADFSGGIDITRGLAGAMGIELVQNFQRPSFAITVPEYWRRWHMSLTNWMRDYVFFPLTLSKMSNKLGRWSRKKFKGVVGRQIPSYLPTFIVFFLIGVWHGASWGYIAFGFYNGMVIVLGMMFKPLFEAANKKLGIKEGNTLFRIWQIIRTFLIMMVGKTLVRAVSVKDGILMTLIAFDPARWDIPHLPWNMVGMGLGKNQMLVLLISCIIFFFVSFLQENGLQIRETIYEQRTRVRWTIYLLGIAAVLIFGIYGPGYTAGEFIYRNF